MGGGLLLFFWGMVRRGEARKPSALLQVFSLHGCRPMEKGAEAPDDEQAPPQAPLPLFPPGS